MIFYMSRFYKFYGLSSEELVRLSSESPIPLNSGIDLKSLGASYYDLSYIP